MNIEQAEYMQPEDEFLDGAANPEEVERTAKEELFASLDAFGQKLSDTRSEAIAGRQASGIEDEWREDEEFYSGIDDANRHESSVFRTKPGAGIETDSKPTGSTVFPNITRPYCDAAAARITDMLMPTDGLTFGINATPVPEMAGIADGEFPADVEQQMLAAMPPEQVEAEKAKLTAAVAEQVRAAQAKAGLAEKQIQDWHIECQYHSECRKAISSAAKIGTGILKGPVPVKRRKVAYLNGAIVVQEKLQPASKSINPWNLYPDPGCGEEIHNGSFVWERDDITRRSLEALKGAGYIDEQIDRCLEEGPHEACKKDAKNDSGINKRDTAGLFEIWYYYGCVNRAEFEAAMTASGREGGAAPADTVNVQVTMVNNRVIKVALNHLDTGEFPYDLAVLYPREGSPFGVSIARLMRTAQRIITAAWRAMMDNAGRSAGPQLLFNGEYVQPEDGLYEIAPWKPWRLVKALDGNMRMDDVFAFVKIDMLQSELAAIIEMGLRMAEDSTGLPMIMQGQTNSATPDTVGGMQLQNNNASTVLRRIARLFDDRITEPHVRRYYTYLMQYGDDNMKGDFSIDAKGSSALVERDAQAPILLNLMQLFQNPIYKKDPSKAASEFLKAQRFDETRFDYDDEQWQQIVENMSQPQQDSSLQVAQIREEGATQRKTAEIESRERLAQAEQEMAVTMAQYEQDVTAYCEAMANNRNTDALKTKLADTTLKLKAQAGMNSQVMTPPTEPAGRAPAGQAFQR